MVSPILVEAIALHVLTGILAAAFLAWAGVVWHASTKAFKLANDISIRVGATMDLIVSRLEKLEERMTLHEGLHAHAGAHADMEAMRHEVQTLRELHNRDVANLRGGHER